MLQRVPGQVVVDRSRRSTQAPESQPGEHKLRSVLQVERHQLTGLHADRMEEMRIFHRQVQRLGVVVFSLTGPNAPFAEIFGRRVVEDEPGIALAVLYCPLLVSISYPGYTNLFKDHVTGFRVILVTISQCPYCSNILGQVVFGV